MFYAHFVLSKKGPLARIWLAAHWDKKLTKAHVFETNVSSCVDSIIHPKVKMALRTSGHLLLGVVRIHSRKAKYLLADCNEAFVKIKMAFRPGVVDLPEENREAAFTAITLPEVFHDFDTAVPDLNDAEVQKQFTLNQSRVEDITMREDLGNISLPHEDGFGDLGFADDREVMRGGGGHDESVYKAGESSTLLGESSSKGKDHTMDASLDKQMDLGLDEPIRDDGFGGEMMGDGILGEGFMEAGGGLFDEQPEIQAADVSMPAGNDGASSVSSGPVSVKKQQAQKQVQPKESSQEDTPTAEHQATTSAVADQTTLVPNEDEAFALEPIDITGVKETRQRRKRKLVVDEIKELAGDLIKAQLKDTSDIVTTLDLAPPTKKLMLWKETGGAEKLFSLPGRQLSSQSILLVFRRNLTADVPKGVISTRDADDMEVDEPEVARDANNTTTTIEAVPREQESTLVADKTQDEPSTSAAPDMTMMSMRRGSVSSSDGGDYGGDLFGGDYDDDYDIPSVAPQSVQRPVLQADEEDEDDEQEGETTEEREERRLNKKAHQMLMTIRARLQNESSVQFNDLTSQLYRKQVAAKFYTLLVLKKQQAIEVKQHEAFADIEISRGPEFEVVV
ncbi:double-strand-break repair protein rad21 homolog [Amphiura filiformis]|uniref:double-strand-break repair protein rad21 homolog n=1 Tax=Amphiura filiformis TaxID=82378 RepID=UPI003B215B22